mgnify:CR=1 FL=1
MLQPNPMPLSQLLPDMDLGELGALRIRGLTLDSRQVIQGDLFVALVGHEQNGRDFIPAALAAGAVAVLMEQAPSGVREHLEYGAPVIALADLPNRVSELAGRFHRQPGQKVRVIGVTGTNGKTSCSLLLAQLLAQAEGSAGVMGTLGYGVLCAGKPMAAQISALTSTGLTTPDPIRAQAIMADFCGAGAGFATLEVSSHSLAQKRLAALPMEVGIFTNLSQDHLDYHGDMQSYGRAKAELLRQPGLAWALVNRDDPWALSLLEQLPDGVRGLSYSVGSLQADGSPQADLYITERTQKGAEQQVKLATPWGRGQFTTALLGDINLSNLLAAVGAAGCLGLALESVLASVSELVPIPGRMESVVVDPEHQDIQVLVDYAHTPDALDKSLQALRIEGDGRLWCLFGCGGDRDKTKRASMGRLAEQHSDYVIVTNDNPRSEDPAEIVAQILSGMANEHQCLVIPDRAQAIDLAIAQARAGDRVLIAGKGHEDYQIFARETQTFSDRDQACQSLRRRLERQQTRGKAS